MNRHLLIIAICLLLGAVVSVAVAWACGHWSKTRGDTNSLASDADWPRAVPSDWPQPTFRATAWGFGRTIVFFSADTRRGFYAQRLYQWGWPLRALESEAHAWAQPPGRLTTITASIPKPIDSAHGFLWICPAWPGFAVNTIIYGALFWPLMSGLFSVRGFVRVRRGLCPTCAYPMGESAVCTECGKELPKRATTP